jgi:hypothetical protein
MWITAEYIVILSAEKNLKAWFLKKLPEYALVFQYFERKT